MAAKLSQGLEEHVTCPICLDQYQDPRILPCLHTYCRRCLEELLGKGHRKASIECPECREVVQVEDITSLRVNIWINRDLSLLKLSKAENNQGGKLLCNNCDSREPAKARCFDCEKYMCNACVTAHDRIMALKDHKLMTLEEINTTGNPVMDKPTLCDRHKGKKQKLFCEDCKILICKDCTLIDHKDHNYLFRVDVAEKYKDELRNKIESTSGPEKKLASALKSVKGMQERVRLNSEAIEKEIDDTIDAKIQALEERRKSLKQESRNITALKMKKLSTHEDGLLMHSTALQSAVHFTENILTKGSTSDILSMVEQLTSRLSELSEKYIDNEVDVEDGVVLNKKNNPKFKKDSAAPDPTQCDLDFISRLDSNSKGRDLINITIRNYKRELIMIKKDRILIKCPFKVDLTKSDKLYSINTGKQFGLALFSYSPPNAEIEISIDGQPIKGSPVKLVAL